MKRYITMGSLKQNKTKTKVLVIGLDGASPNLIESWKDELPNLKSIMESGVWGKLESTIPPATCPAWNCFMTGKNPGKIGVYDFVEQFDMSTGPKVTDYTKQDGRAVWEFLGDSNKKVCVVNVPMTYPPIRVNGLLVSGMISTSKLGVYTYPEHLAKELDDVAEGYEIAPDVVAPKYMKGSEEGFLKELYRVTDKRLKITNHLITKYNWDFFMVVFVALDLIQHFFWHHMDENHPAYNPEKSKIFKDAIKNCYKKMDSMIGELVSLLDENTTIMIMSDHGFGPFHGYFLTNSWLEQEGFLKRGNGESGFKNFLVTHNLTGKKIKEFLLKTGMYTYFKKIKNLLPAALHELVPHEDNPLFRNINWAETQAYGLGNFGLIYINREGRESKGTVKQQEYRKLRENIIKRLLELKHPTTGKNIVTKIYKSEEIYSGKYVDKSPDIIIFLDEGRYNQGEWLLGSKIWLDTLSAEAGITGCHRIDGIWMMKGPNVRSNIRIDSNIVDLAPTILHVYNLQIPEDMDGKVVKEAFILEKEIEYQKEVEEKKKSYVYSKEEEEAIKERLRGLGYLG
ncbi:MAG: alkaline phosphatase family protein [Candidatus Hodarchaeales archaeon]|jgi:predicted AlkP superfamily phosphohydrolase/phosphomutase